MHASIGMIDYANKTKRDNKRVVVKIDNPKRVRVERKDFEKVCVHERFMKRIEN